MPNFNLTKSQEQFWILNNIYQGNTAYNIPAVFRMNGIPDLNYLNKSINILVERHDLLRANVFEEDGSPKMKINPDVHHKIEVIKLLSPPEKSEIPNEVISEVHQAFNLDKGNLFRIKLFIFKNNICFLTIVFHHIIVDLRSKEIFANELSQLYNSFVSEEEINLPEISLSSTFKPRPMRKCASLFVCLFSSA